MLITPAILTKDRRQAGEWLTRIRDGRKFERVQVDFMDGDFVKNTTIKPNEIDLLPYFSLMFDAHLMVVEKNLAFWLQMVKKTGYDRIIVQMESISKPEDFSGLALDVHSPIEAIEPYLKNLEVVVAMSIEPGFGGQEFVNEVINKVKRLSDLRKVNNYKYKICVDGGVEMIHLPILEKSGADEVAVGAERVLSW